MRNIWVISDTHFNHDNILKFQGLDSKRFRGDIFSSTEEMNETIIQNWNNVVKPSDIIYHLGDVFMGNKEQFLQIAKRLNGRKRLIVGNHDDIKQIAKLNVFQKISAWRMFPEYRVLMTHVPVHPSSLQREGHSLINVHGHTHEKGSPEGPYVSACVELNNYTPVNIEDI